MPGEVDPIYNRARAALLDALEALGPHRDAVILVGAQAVYCHAGAADIAVAEFTADGDLAIDPRVLDRTPPLDELLQAAGFVPGKQPGIWVDRYQTPIDLLVPESLGGGGRRGARLSGHGRRAARKVHGLEAALVDHAPITIAALAPDNPREMEVEVAGPAALLIAKLHKIAERVEDGTRVNDKDALDVLRLLRTANLAAMAVTLRTLQDKPVCCQVTAEALAHLPRLFSDPESAASQMAARAAAPLEPAATTAASCSALTNELLGHLGDS